MFFGAAPTIGSAHKGLETQRVFLGTATPGDVPGNFHSALAALADRATYFYSAGGKYWYDLQANISRRAKDQAERLHIEEVYAEIAERLASQAKTRGAFAGVHVCPEDAADIPDIDEARLVILHPKLTHKRGVGDSDAIAFAKSATEHRGAANRTYRNMLVYLAGDRDRIEELERSVREYLGWTEILAKEDDLNLTTSQRNQATERQAKASETTDARLLGAYQWALVPTGQPIEIQATKVEGQATSLAERVSRRLGNDGALTVQHAAPAIRHQLDTDRGQAVGGRARDRRRALAAVRRVPVHAAAARPRGARRGPHRAAAAVGAGGLRARRRLRRGEREVPRAGPADRRRSTVAVDRRDADRAARTGEGAAGGRGARRAAGRRPGAGPGPGPGPGPQPPSPRRPRGKTRFFGSKRLQADRYASDFKKLADEVLGPLGATPGVTLNVTIEIEATAPDGFDDAKVRTVSENATTLKFEQSGFEEG